MVLAVEARVGYRDSDCAAYVLIHAEPEAAVLSHAWMMKELPSYTVLVNLPSGSAKAVIEPLGAKCTE